MSDSVRMPALGESVTEGTVTRWLKQVGDTVAVDEPLLEISTDKVDTEVPSPVAGTILELVVAEDETVAVGTTLARIGSGADAGQDRPAPAAAPESAAAESPAPEAPPQQEAPQQAPLQQEAPAPVEQAAPAAHPQAPAGGYLTPLVRKLAAEKGVDLSTIDGTGVGGRIRKEDVLAAAARAERERAERAEAERRRLEQEQEQAQAQAQAQQATSQPAAAVERPTRSH